MPKIKIHQLLNFIVFFCSLNISLMIIILCTEIITRQDIQSVQYWSIAHKPALILSILIGNIAYIIYLPFMGKQRSILIIAFSSLILAIANRLKFETLGLPVAAGDLFLYSQFYPSLKFIYPNIEKGIGPFLCGLVLVILLVKRSRLIMKNMASVVAKAVIITSISLIVSANIINELIQYRSLDRFLMQQGVHYKAYSPTDSANELGIGLSFFWTLPVIKYKMPQAENLLTYENLDSKNTLARLKELAKNPEKYSRKRPHIVFILSESFIDPDILPGVVFNEPSPLSIIRQNFPNIEVGKLIVPTFGGGTCNSEFELLTGMSSIPFPSLTMPYMNFINRDVPSIAWRAKAADYNTVAIHPYAPKFWNREEVYPHLGIDKFVSIESFKDAPRIGHLVSDSSVTNKIIEELRNNPEKSKFILAITIQNHGMWLYPRENLAEHDFEFSPIISLVNQRQARIYINGTYDAVNALNQLLQFAAKEIDREIIVFFFGDHFPSLGPEYGYYVNSGFISSKDADRWSENEIIKLYQTPYLIFSNRRKLDNYGLTSLMYIGRKLGDYLNLPQGPLDSYNKDLEDQYKGFLRKLTIDQDGMPLIVKNGRFPEIIDRYFRIERTILNQ